MKIPKCCVLKMDIALMAAQPEWRPIVRKKRQQMDEYFDEHFDKLLLPSLENINKEQIRCKVHESKHKETLSLDFSDFSQLIDKTVKEGDRVTWASLHLYSKDTLTTTSFLISGCTNNLSEAMSSMK